MMLVRKDNLVLTYACGKNFFEDPTFWVFVRSFRKNVTNADLVILSHDIPESMAEFLLDLDILVVDVPPSDMRFLYRDRHMAFYRYLNDHGHKYKHVLVTDCRDVLFQADPFLWIDEWKERHRDIKGQHGFLNDFVVMTAEGFKMTQSGFACIEHFEFERDVPPLYKREDKDRWVINGGVFLGTPRALLDWHFLVWITTTKTIGRCTDQATVNWLMNYLDDDNRYQISFPQHDHLCLTGEGVKEGSVVPILKDENICNPLEKPYFLVHQWDRILTLKEKVLAQYAH